MSLLIKGMKMPVRCELCQFSGISGKSCELISCTFTGKHRYFNDGQYLDGCPLIEVPSADVVEVVRCKDCKNNYVTTHNHGKQDDPRCDFTDRHLSLADFCSRGERRMDGET